MKYEKSHLVPMTKTVARGRWINLKVSSYIIHIKEINWEKGLTVDFYSKWIPSILNYTKSKD